MPDKELIKALAATLRAYKNAADHGIPPANIHQLNARQLLAHVDARASNEN